MTPATTHARGRRLLAAAAAAGLMLTVTACGDSDGGSHDEHASEVRTASNGDVYNDADVEFATAMIPHHAQALQMTVLAQGRPLDPAVTRLVEQIREAQAPEVETMTDWLTAWGEEVPETSLDHANAGHDMEHTDGSDTGDMPGMMSQAEMDELESASDAEFQDLWLEMMIEHHQGAVEMAQAEQDNGEFADAVRLAESIERTQTEEIAAMEKLVG